MRSMDSLLSTEVLCRVRDWKQGQKRFLFIICYLHMWIVHLPVCGMSRVFWFYSWKFSFSFSIAAHNLGSLRCSLLWRACWINADCFRREGMLYGTSGQKTNHIPGGISAWFRCRPWRAAAYAATEHQKLDDVRRLCAIRFITAHIIEYEMADAFHI